MKIPVNGVAHMMRKALNTLDYRLMDHGERVAYILLKLAQVDGKYTDQQLKKICYLGIFHDIGAYQTELLDSLNNGDNILDFEIKETLPHSIYSYLFLSEHSIFDEFVDIILFHHFFFKKLLKTDCENKELAAKIYIADRIDVMFIKEKVKTVEEVFRFLNSPAFSKEEVEKLKNLEEKEGVITHVLDGSYLDKLLDFLNIHNLSNQQIHSLVDMLPHAIDIRSESTVTHTVATVEISNTLAELFNMTQKERTNIYYGALLHDIGKIAISTLILEKDSKLTPNEFSIMKDHVLLSEYILKERVSDEVLQIAIRHHEKLDGTGYPYGLKDTDLNLSERIVAVADILSALLGKRSYKDPFPAEQVISILTSAVDEGKICGEVVNMAVENFDLISNKVLQCSENAVKRYEYIKENGKELFAKYKKL